MSYVIPELYIQLRDGEPYEHPILAGNMREAFPDIDLGSLPKDRFARFIRLPKPPLGRSKVYDKTTYVWDGDVVTDFHHARELTAEELAEQEAELAARVQEAKDTRVAFINQILSAGLSKEAELVWLECLDKHQAWELDKDAPAPMPPFPYKDENGNWVAPAS